GSGPSGALVGLAAVPGITAPPLFASGRSLWSRAVDASLVRRGYAMTSLIADSGQVAGPALAGLLFAVSVWAPLVMCAATALLSAVLLVTGPSAPASHARPQPMPRLRESRGLVGLLTVSILFRAAVGLLQVGVPPLSRRS